MARNDDRVAKLIRLALDQGWTVERTNGGHLCWRPCDKRMHPVYSPSTPSDHRAFLNMRATLRRNGLRC